MNAALKSVAVTAFAAQTLEGETWQGMCRYAVDAVANGKNATAMREEMRAVEKQMKADYDVTAMPAAWRSAKAVVLAAVTVGVALTAGSAVLGKTAVETAIKAARIARGTLKGVDCFKEYIKLATECEKLWAVLSTSQQDAVPTNLKWVI